ncbi:hypothetical protein [Enterobacter sp. KB-221C9]|uniref:hypothetical protein n=1 Tax=Enterobacter sp. KB-221C9 TaxID=3242496 RepID=UPI00309019A7|nr:hypothetical protein AEV23_00068 [Klebsiella phage VB_KpM-AEV23]
MKVEMLIDFNPDVNHPKVQELGAYDLFCEIVRLNLNKGYVRFGLKSLTGQYFINCDDIPLHNFRSFCVQIQSYGGVCH